jgi:protein SCO1
MLQDASKKWCYVVELLIVSILLTFGCRLSWAAPEGSPWGKEYFPNIELIDQDGKTYRFYDDLIKDKAVAINFIYSQCGDSCPAETANLRQVQRILGDRVGKDIFFYSISIDPEHDKPNVLNEYAKKFGISGSGWKFLVGKKSDTILLRTKLGLYREDLEANNIKEHSTSIMIGNEKTGIWTKRSPYDEPNVLARQLAKLAHAQPTQNLGLASFNKANQLPKMSKGEDLYRFRCASCHDLGMKDGLGPGLKGVTKRRDVTWLKRWLKEPDRMLKDEDPIATSLYKQYNKVRMPNLRLTDADVEALIHFLEAADATPNGN